MVSFDQRKGAHACCSRTRGERADESRSFAGQSSSQCPCRIREDYRTNIFVGRTLYLYRISYILYVPAVGGGAGTDRHEQLNVRK